MFTNDCYEGNEIIKNNEQIYYSDGDWIRYENYKIVTGSDGLPLIVPDENTNSTKYNPFDNYPIILVDFLNLLRDASIIHNRELIIDQSLVEESYKKQLERLSKIILKFTKKYGLLGILRSEVNRISIDWETNNFTIVNYNGLVKSFEEYINAFTVHPDKFIQPNKSAAFNSKYEGRTPIEMYFDSLDSYIGDPIYKLHYELINYSKETISLWREFDVNTKHPEDTFKKRFNEYNYEERKWSDELKRYTKLSDIGLSIRFNDEKPLLNWIYPSLLHALKIMYIYDKTLGSKQVMQCPSCGKSFIKNKPSHRYCSTSCGNAMRQKRYREKKKQNSM